MLLCAFDKNVYSWQNLYFEPLLYLRDLWTHVRLICVYTERRSGGRAWESRTLHAVCCGCVRLAHLCLLKSTDRILQAERWLVRVRWTFTTTAYFWVTFTSFIFRLYLKTNVLAIGKRRGDFPACKLVLYLHVHSLQNVFTPAHLTKVLFLFKLECNMKFTYIVS